MSPFVIFVNIGLVGSGQASGVVKLTQGLGQSTIVRRKKPSRHGRSAQIASHGNVGTGAIRRCNKNTNSMFENAASGGQTRSVDCYSIGQISSQHA
jgi:hypothetical protein